MADEKKQKNKQRLSNDTMTKIEVNANSVYNVTEVAQIMQCSYCCVMKMIHRGELDARVVGKSYKLLGSEVLRYFLMGKKTAKEGLGEGAQSQGRIRVDRNRNSVAHGM